MRDVAIVGVGQTDHGRREDVSTAELAQEAVAGALAAAGIERGDVESVFFGSAPDALLGVASADQWLAGAVGAAGKPLMRLSTGGSTGGSAAIAAHHAVAAGLCDVAVAVAVERANEAHSVQMLMNTNFDPIYEKDFGLNAISTYALATVDHMIRHGTTQEQLAAISVRNHVNALRNPHAHLKLDITLDDVMSSPMLCWPLKRLEVCPRSDGACAIVVASADRAGELAETPAWFSGLKSYSDSYFLGERPALSRREHIEMAARDAYEQAGVTDPVRDIDVAEMQNPFTISELMAIEALGFSALGEGGRFVDEGLGEIGSEIAINPSGGALSSNPVGATSLIRVAEAALQVMDEAGDRQVPNTRRALAQCSGGSIQFGIVAVLERRDD